MMRFFCNVAVCAGPEGGVRQPGRHNVDDCSTICTNINDKTYNLFIDKLPSGSMPVEVLWALPGVQYVSGREYFRVHRMPAEAFYDCMCQSIQLTIENTIEKDF